MKYFKQLVNEDEILEELYLADILDYIGDTTLKNIHTPYHYECKIGNCILKRAHSYWIASFEGIGLPLKYALMLHERRNPINDEILGKIIRAGGDGAGISPNSYVSQPIYNEQLENKLEDLGFKKEYSEFLNKEYIPITHGKVAELCNEGKLQVDRYVNLYHIDNQIGLNEFVKFIINHSKNI